MKLKTLLKANREYYEFYSNNTAIDKRCNKNDTKEMKKENYNVFKFGNY